MSNRSPHLLQLLPEGTLRCPGLVLVGGFALASFIAPDLLAAVPAGSEPVAGGSESSSWILVVLFAVTLILVSGLIIGGLVLWGKKQDDINHMMSFCIKFLIDTQDEAERCAAAKALGGAKDPGALLVLVDVINDDQAEESVREAALAALQEMGLKYRKYRKTIDDLIAATQAQDNQKVIDILTSEFERKSKKYVQTPYVIGRAFMRLGNHEDAREWLHLAEYRNRKTPTYGYQIKAIVDVCNEHLFAEGDRLLKARLYHDAKAQYAVASHSLGDEDKKRFASYLREACVYSRLNDYIDADQALLQALQHHHETDMTLTLNKLIQKALEQSRAPTVSQRELEQLKVEIDECVSDIMKRLALSGH
jgi:tetratricopeptide (TPR) repeat protein